MWVTIHNRVIPLSIPGGFVFLGEGFFLVAGFLLALHPEALFIPRHPWGLAMAHLFLLGLGSSPATSRRKATTTSGSNCLPACSWM